MRNVISFVIALYVFLWLEKGACIHIIVCTYHVLMFNASCFFKRQTYNILISDDTRYIKYSDFTHRFF